MQFLFKIRGQRWLDRKWEGLREMNCDAKCTELAQHEVLWQALVGNGETERKIRTLCIKGKTSRNFSGTAVAAGAWGWQSHCHLWADYLVNVGVSMSHNPVGLYDMLRDSFTVSWVLRIPDYMVISFPSHFIVGCDCVYSRWVSFFATASSMQIASSYYGVKKREKGLLPELRSWALSITRSYTTAFQKVPKPPLCLLCCSPSPSQSK
jgi:hypothetical protein